VSAAPRAFSAAPGAVSTAPAAQPTAVILTMVPPEYLAAYEQLDADRWERVEHGTIYAVGRFQGRHAQWTVAVTEIGPGNAVAAAEVERAVRVFSPEVVLLIGVGGGRKDVALGDVVAADAVYDYETGKATADAFVPRIKTHNPSYALVQRARRVATEGTWRERILPGCPTPPPTAFVKPIAAGSQVIADQRSATARRLDQYCGDALAVDMEGYGFLHGVYLNRDVEALVVRGISDLLSGKDEAADARWQPIAARNAAAFGFEVLSAYQPTPRRNPAG
jgi:nucleoside phosphorylase